MTPVLITRLRIPRPSSCHVDALPASSKHRSAASPMRFASSRPALPVTALAQPELITRARSPAAALRRSTSWLTSTGAARNLFWVKTAAAVHGVSDAIKVRSAKRVLDGLMPTWATPAPKPAGYVPELGTYFLLDGGTEPLAWRRVVPQVVRPGEPDSAAEPGPTWWPTQGRHGWRWTMDLCPDGVVAFFCW